MNLEDIKLRGTMYINNIDNPLKLYESYLETNTSVLILYCFSILEIYLKKRGLRTKLHFELLFSCCEFIKTIL